MKAERVRQLAIETDAWYDESILRPGFSWEEKFAELILKEATENLRQKWYELNKLEPISDSPRDVGYLVGEKAGINVALNIVAELRDQK